MVMARPRALVLAVVGVVVVTEVVVVAVVRTRNGACLHVHSKWSGSELSSSPFGRSSVKRISAPTTLFKNSRPCNLASLL